VANGWNWIDSIDGTTLTAAHQHAFTVLRATADATGQGKIDIVTAVQGPPAPEQPFAARMAALVAANAPGPQVLALIQLGTTVERLALLDDAATATFIHGACAGHPLQVYAVADAERGQFLQKNEFMKITLTRLAFGESLGFISNRAYIDQLGATLDAVSAEFATWLAAMPAANSMSAPEQMSVRAVRLVIGNAANKQTTSSIPTRGPPRPRRRCRPRRWNRRWPRSIACWQRLRPAARRLSTCAARPAPIERPLPATRRA
jgi:hypothetical protein